MGGFRWPWVSRAELDRAVDELRVQRERYDALLGILLPHRLALLQGERPESGHAPNATAPLRTQRDPVLDAIAQKAGSNVALRRSLAMYARGRRTDEPRASDRQIAMEILHWRDAAEDEALVAAVAD